MPWFIEVRRQSISCIIGALIGYLLSCKGRHAITGRQVAIKKIKIGQFKDGLDMSAVREVRYLRELQHPNVIEVGINQLVGRVSGQSKRPVWDSSQLLDVFSAKTNLNLVLEYLDSDLEVIIKDRSIAFFKPQDVKSWMAMTIRGLEFCHRNWILHRVGELLLPSALPLTLSAM